MDGRKVLGAAAVAAVLMSAAAASLPLLPGADAPDPPVASADPGAHRDHASAHAHGGALPRSILEPAGWDPENGPDLSRAPPFPLEPGRIPSRDEALDFPNGYSRFIAKGDGGLDRLRAEGHLHGEGTPQSPYVLEEFYVEGDLSISSTHQALVLRNGYVEGQLRLNYVGERLYVHHVYARDLRVNENEERSGENTGGLFHDNRFGFVGQIRHFVGEFRHNDVGPRPAGVVQEALGDAGVVRIPESVVFNLDGFHAAHIHHNRFVGSVDIKLHGHNHGDCFTCPVHDHAIEDDPHGENHSDDLHRDAVARSLGFQTHHSVRYASLHFHDNEVRADSGWALRYNDRNHDGDDRTANSEPNPHLEDPHIHFQDVTIERNRVAGGRILVDVFNAEDERHPAQNHGILRLRANEATVPYVRPSPLQSGAATPGIDARKADGVELTIEGNKVRFVDVSSASVGGGALDPVRRDVELTGVRLDEFDGSNVSIVSNAVESGTYGVFASRLSETVNWRLSSNDFRTTHAWRGQDVANPPQEE